MVSLGLTEGSSRVHTGQGTTNRKFYFEDFFLEVLWVHDEAEARSHPAVELGLWDRSRFRETGRSRFGLCLVNTPDTDTIFAKSQLHQPAYFPEGMSIDFINDPARPWLPMLFRLPFRGPKKPSDEPRNHALGWEKLTKAQFSIPKQALEDPLIQLLQQASQLDFIEGDTPTLGLEFDHGRGEKVAFPELDLSMMG